MKLTILILSATIAVAAASYGAPGAQSPSVSPVVRRDASHELLHEKKHHHDSDSSSHDSSDDDSRRHHHRHRAVRQAYGSPSTYQAPVAQAPVPTYTAPGPVYHHPAPHEFLYASSESSSSESSSESRESSSSSSSESNESGENQQCDNCNNEGLKISKFGEQCTQDKNMNCAHPQVKQVKLNKKVKSVVLKCLAAINEKVSISTESGANLAMGEGTTEQVITCVGNNIWTAKDHKGEEVLFRHAICATGIEIERQVNLFNGA